MLMHSSIKNTVFRILGWPNYLRRLQWFSIHRMLGADRQKIVLDLGAGPMQYAIAVAQNDSAYVIAADLDFRLDCVDVEKRNRVVPLRANGQSLPLADKSIDRILMSSLLHMVPEPLKLLQECHRVLKQDGHVVLSVPNHYQFIPKLMKSFAGSAFCYLFRLPHTHEELVCQLNKRFHVGGPQGYYSIDDLNSLLKSSGFDIVEHKYAPGWFGSLLWEFAILGYVRFGNIAFHLLFLTYPLARFFDIFIKSSIGSEHIVKALPIYD